MINTSNSGNLRGAQISGCKWGVLTHTTADVIAEQFSAATNVTVLAMIMQNDSDSAMTVGPTTDGNTITLQPGDQFMVPAVGESFSLSDWYLVCAAGAGKVLTVLYAQRI